MKISNSKKELARIISENGGWRDGAESAAQSKSDNAISFYCDTAYREGDRWWGSYIIGGDIAQILLLPNWHQTTLSREEYLHLHPAPDAMRQQDFGSVDDCGRHHGSNHTIEQLAADYQQAAMLAEIKQNDADAAKADADARLKALELAGEAIGLLVSPINEKQEPEMVITDWRDLQVGDEISVKHLKNVYSKSSVLVVGAREVAIRNHAGARKTVNLDETDWSFIRRP